MRKVISNTTPLITLANIGQLDLLRKLYGTIHIPEAVLKEIKREPARSTVRRCDWILSYCDPLRPENRMFSAKLHAGEIAVILLAEEMQADLLLMDDNAAKKTAKFLGYHVTGTLGVLLRAKREGYLGEIRPQLRAIIADGMYISEQILDLVLEEAGEK